MLNVCMIVAVKKKKNYRSGTEGSPSQDMTSAEGRPVMEGIQGRTVTDSVPATETVRFIQGTYCTWYTIK